MSVWAEIMKYLDDPHWVRDSPEMFISFEYVFAKMKAKLQFLTSIHTKA